MNIIFFFRQNSNGLITEQLFIDFIKRLIINLKMFESGKVVLIFDKAHLTVNVLNFLKS